jgi:hypothetical protein
MRRVLLFALGLTLAGCAGAGSRPPAPATARPAPAALLQPSPLLLVGRVLAVDGTRHTVIVDVSPYASLPTVLAGRVLLARDPGDLHPTARLEASPYLRGLTLGTRLLDGLPVVGDEVVLLPAAASAAIPPAGLSPPAS